MQLSALAETPGHYSRFSLGASKARTSYSTAGLHSNAGAGGQKASPQAKESEVALAHARLL